MNTHTTQKLVLFLADPSIGDEEFRSIVDWIKDGGSSKVFRAAKDIRSQLDDLGRKRRDIPPPKAHARHYGASRKAIDRIKLRHELTERIRELLKGKHGLGTGEILREISMILESNIDFTSKTGLEAGIRKLAKIHSESSVLSAAYQIAKERDQEGDLADWKLRDD